MSISVFFELREGVTVAYSYPLSIFSHHDHRRTQ
jgi:hypothetical protein